MKLNFATRGYCCCLLTLMLCGCAFAPWPRDGVPGATPEARIANANDARKAQPESTTVLKDVRVTQEQVAYELLQDADTALREGRTDDADKLYGRLLAIDPANARALGGQAAIGAAREQTRQVEEARVLFGKDKVDEAEVLLHKVLLQNPTQGAALALQAEITSKREVVRKAPPPRLKPPSDKPVTLELRDANIKMVFEALSRSTGINFILDKDIKQDAKATVFIKQARIEDAIDLVLSTNGLQKKALSETTALVFPNTAAKLKDYQDLIIRSFYLTNASAKEVAVLIKTMLKTKDVYVDDRLNMLTMRDTPEVIRIAEKLVAANDLADPEVMLEMEVLEVSRSRLQQLGIEYPDRIAVNSLIPITTVTAATGAIASSTVNTATPLTLQGLLHLNSGRFDVSPNPAVNFKKTTGDVNLLANPRIRVRNNEKAKVLVGDKVPIITTVATAGVGSSQSVQYLDVGLKLEVEPRIALDDFVNIKIALEVSSLGDATNIPGGGVVYRIGTRNASTVLRLKDGETQILAGLISDDERKSANKLPGLGDIPLLGRLFSNQQDQKSKTEIVLAITPRIVNNIRRPDAEISEYWSGTDTIITDRPQIIAPISAGGAANSARNLHQAPQAESELPAIPPTEEQPPAQTEPAKKNPVPVDPLQYQPAQPPTIINTPEPPAI